MRIEIGRAHGYYARATCGEYEGCGDTTTAALADLAAAMGMDLSVWNTWHVTTEFEGGEPILVVFDPDDGGDVRESK